MIRHSKLLSIAIVAILSIAVANQGAGFVDAQETGSPETGGLETGGPETGEATPVDAADVHDQLRQLKQDVETAVNDSQWETLASLLTDNVIVTWLDGTQSHGRAEVLDYMKTKTEGETPIVESFSVDVTVDDLSDLYGETTAAAFGSATSEFVLRGRSMSVSGPWSATVVREDGVWKLAHVHASVGVFDNPLLSWAWRFAWVGATVALILGLVIGWWLGRRGKTPFRS